VTLWKPATDWKPIRDETVKAALEILLDVRNHPVLLIDPYVLPIPFAKTLTPGWEYIRQDV